METAGNLVIRRIVCKGMENLLRRYEMRRQIVVLLLVCVVVCTACGAEKTAGPGVGLTIYNDNFAVVRESREMSFDAGVNTVKFTDVASAIDPTSVNFKCLSAPGAISILEQNYEYDLVNTESLLKRYIDKKVSLYIKGSGADGHQQLGGVLLAAVGGDLVLLNEQGGIEIVARGSVDNISLEELPEDLVTKPTLVWLAAAQEAGEQLCRVTYTTGAMGWKADYSAVLNEGDTALDFSGWVTIDNKSGAGYKDARLKLIAGDVRRVTPPRAVSRRMKRGYAMEADAAGGFEEKPFMEYHMYTLGRRSTIKNNQVKQIEFIEPAAGVLCKKIFVYERSDYWYRRGAGTSKKVMVKIEFENAKENQLGMALPKGKVRVFKKDPADESLQFVGEDTIDHTPKDEKLSLYIGDAFDIVAEHTLVDKKEWLGRHIETHKVEIRNRKDEQAAVFVDEKFARWVEWKMDKSSQKWEKKDAYTARFPVTVGANSTVTVEYTVSWKPWR